MATSRVREIRPDDVSDVVTMVHELALYEQLPKECHLEPEQLHAALFADHPALFGLVAVAEDGEAAGYALYFLNYSTWEGVHGIYLEDLYVRPDTRGSGLGKALLARLAEIATERGYARVEWAVLDWNAPSIAFYESLGAVPMNGWTTYRLTGPALSTFAAGQTREI